MGRLSNEKYLYSLLLFWYFEVQDELLVTYEIFNRRFEVKTSEEEHFKLQNDDNYSRNYFEKILANTEPEVSQVDTVVQGTFNWSRNVILLLVDQYKKNTDKFRDPKIKKKAFGQLLKWRNMKKTYVNIKDSIKSTGNDRISWEYFDDFEEIYCTDRTVNIPKTISSLQSTTNISTEVNDEQSSTGEKAGDTSTEPLQTAPKERINVLKRKRVAMKGITLWRSNILSVEKEKVYELRKLREAVERNNDLADKNLNYRKKEIIY
ncbi:hypothetical protein FQR65_LT15491 [Abscondita terminalis]|nr:hypothetical protein FQR65_LT15491 [Abscondita terminalis]